jgi:sensor histidine kinase regulating citrate/malate metabolism
MRDIDIVSVFSNLLNNAIESCEHSENKIIYVNLYKMNNNFAIIKIENSCDKPPIKENGFYKTSKISKGEHGIGLKSVVKALKQYDGDLRMEYNSEEKVFTALVMMSLI